MPCAKSLWLCLTFCDLMDCSHPGSSVHRILRQEYWNTGIGFSPRKGSSQFRDRTHVSYISCIGRWVLYHQCHLGSPNMPCTPLENPVSGLLLSLHKQCSPSPQGRLTVAKESEVTQLCPTLCDPMDCSLSGFSIHRFSRQECWSGLPFPSPGDLPNPGIEPGSPTLQADALPSEPPGKSVLWPRQL